MKKKVKKEKLDLVIKNLTLTESKVLNQFKKISLKNSELIKRGLTNPRESNLLSREFLNSPNLNFNSNL